MKKKHNKTLHPKPFLEKYGKQMSKMNVGNVLYVTFFGSRTRIQKTEDGYIIEPWNQVALRNNL